MIINVDPSHEPGSHWFCLKKVKEGFELFDSWDLPQMFLGDDFIEKIKRKVVSTMPYAIQNEDSHDVTCGWYCISFINSELPLQKFAKLFYEDIPGSFPEIEKHNLTTMSSFLKKIEPEVRLVEEEQDLLNATFHPTKREHISPRNVEEVKRRYPLRQRRQPDFWRGG